MQRLDKLRQNIQSVFLGNRQAVDRMIVCLLARGHVLVEDVPGVGKTILAGALSRSIDCRFSRLQLTPDLMPSDVLGVTVYSQQTGRFDFKPGPIFCNILLADEINRTSPRTQSALLEAMNESQVSVDGLTRPLEQPFMVVATQNPFEFEGTYNLPESQMDRFLMRFHLGYPSSADEARILTHRPGQTAMGGLKPVMSLADVLELQARVDEVKMDPALVDYIVKFASATRLHESIHVGLSPRGALALSQAARATALLNQRDFVVPDDILGNVPPVCSHRITTRHHAQNGDGRAAEAILKQIVQTMPCPM